MGMSIYSQCTYLLRSPTPWMNQMWRIPWVVGGFGPLTCVEEQPRVRLMYLILKVFNHKQLTYWGHPQLEFADREGFGSAPSLSGHEETEASPTMSSCALLFPRCHTMKKNPQLEFANHEWFGSEPSLPGHEETEASPTMLSCALLFPRCHTMKKSESQADWTQDLTWIHCELNHLATDSMT
jgi:hypothetical protein